MWVATALMGRLAGRGGGVGICRAARLRGDRPLCGDIQPSGVGRLVVAGALGGFNRSSQHVQFDWPASTGPELRREFSIRGSCGAVY